VAIRTGRKIALEGRSVKNHVGIASDLDLVRGLSQVIVTTEAAAQLPRTKVIIIASGTQGEERSALGRFSTGMNKTFPVIAGDTVVLSSRFIPGSELAISRMIDRFLELGARVVHKGIDPDVHVSGHGGMEEIRSVIETVSPRAFMPIHGTLRHLTACAELARTQGVSQTVVATNGQVVELDSGGLAILKETVDAGRVHVDAGISIPPSVLRERWLMGNRGVLVVAWAMGGDSQPGEITVVHRGVVAEEMTDWFCSLVRDELRRTLDEMAPDERHDDSIFTGKIRSTLRKLTQKTISREPYVIINPYQ
jgi:ribonuclease J